MWKDVQGPAGSTGATILIGDIVRLSQAWAKSVVVKGFTMKKHIMMQSFCSLVFLQCNIDKPTIIIIKFMRL